MSINLKMYLLKSEYGLGGRIYRMGKLGKVAEAMIERMVISYYVTTIYVGFISWKQTSLSSCSSVI